MAGTNLAFQVFQTESLAEQTATLQIVDLDELNRVERRLIQCEKSENGVGGKTLVFFKNRKGRLDKRTLGHFLGKGLPYTAKGLNSILKNTNWEQRLDSLQRLEAQYEILKSSSVHFENITEAMIEEQRAMIQQFSNNYQPSQWG